MTKTLKIVFTIIILTALGVGTWLAAPLFYDKEVSEELPPELQEALEPAETPSTVNSPEPATNTTPTSQVETREGNFTGFDRAHNGSGTARILSANNKTYVRFEENFEVTNGPDLYVHLGRNGQYDAEANLGRLKGNKGSQNYEIPSDIDPSGYDEVWVWCRAFSVPFAKAELN